MKILLADDERIARTMVERRLSSWGYEVIAVGDGATALERLTNDPEICLAVVDWVMPKMDGVEVCRRVREQNREPYVYFILLTARQDDDHLVAGLSAGADDYLIKPCNLAELRLRLRAGRRVVELQGELIAAREKLRHEAMHDPLTGLLNRGAWLPQLGQELARCLRQGTHASIVVADLDYFKRVNDTYGHAAGDEVLVEMARRLAGDLRGYDSVARMGGEEFAMVLPGCDTRLGTIVAERLRAAVAAKPFLVHGQELNVTASLGVASTDAAQGTDQQLLLEAADVALYRAKATGRNRVACATRADYAHVTAGPPSLGTEQPTELPDADTHAG